MRTRIFTIALFLAHCTAPEEQVHPAFSALEPIPLDPAVEAVVDGWLAELTVDEKLTQLHGTGLLPDRDRLWPVAGVERVGVPAMRMVDGPRGLASGTATAFPVAMARAATWDLDLERRVGQAVGLEASAYGADVILAPAINLLRHPAWGRAQETYGEDPYLLGAMGVSFTQGAQEHVMASVKHFAVNSIEDTRFDVDVQVDERTLREVYLPHFRKVVREGRVASVMSAYNKVNGLYCAENPPLLTQILREDWGFQGFVESDWALGVRSAAPSLLAGLDIEMPDPEFFGGPLAFAVSEGTVPMEDFDQAVRRVLRRKAEYGLVDTERPERSMIGRAEHVALAREAAAASLVLLRNEGVLPLSPSVGSVAIVGELAGVASTGDNGSSSVTPPYVITAAQGLEDALGAERLVRVVTNTPDATALASIGEADVAVVVVGLSGDDEGENLPGVGGGDRADLGLSAEHNALVEAVIGANDNTIVVLQGGSALVLEDWADDVPGLLMAWYGGMEGGHGLADVLTGARPATGYLPLSVPRSADQLVPFDNVSLTVTYGPLHGYRHLDAEGLEPRFPFGFGLSYASFEVGDVGVEVDGTSTDATVRLTTAIRNTSAQAGAAVVQVYASRADSAVSRVPRWLVGFARVVPAPNGEATAVIEVPARELAYFDEERGWVLEPGTYTFQVGLSSRDAAQEVSVTL